MFERIVVCAVAAISDGAVFDLVRGASEFNYGYYFVTTDLVNFFGTAMLKLFFSLLNGLGARMTMQTDQRPESKR